MTTVFQPGFLKTLLINVLVITLLLVALEIVLRLIYPDLHPVGEDTNLFLYDQEGGYGYQPLSSGYAHGAWFEIDEYGHRLSTQYADKPKTLLVIGDSVTVGVGVDADKTYPSLLNARLTDYTVINAAVTGYAFPDYARILRLELAQQQVDGVIVGICLNDYAALSQAGIVEGLTRNQGKTWEDYRLHYPNLIIRSLRYLNDHYFDFNKYFKQYWMTSLWIKSLLSDTQKNYYLYDEQFYQQDNAEELLAVELAKLQNIAASAEVWIKFVIFPYEYQLRETESAGFSPQQLILQAGKDSGADVMDLSTGLLAAESSSELFLYLDPMHFSEYGHQYAADIIELEIAEN